MRWQRITKLVFLGLLAAAAQAKAQAPSPGAGAFPHAAAMPAPLYVRLAGPGGMKIAVSTGASEPRVFPAPCILGLRPGYRYTIELQTGEGNLTQRLCASFDVVGSLRGTGELHPREHPAAISFSADDFKAASAGTVVTKIVVLERPETALPIATRADLPIELEIPLTGNPLQDAASHGRPLAILHLGSRLYAPDELAALSVPGTMLLPGESVLPPPRDPPCLPWVCYSLEDPKAGLPCAAEEACFHDGGDGGNRAGFGPGGKIVGLDPSDTIAEYVNARGEKKLAVSNKVCFCVPRYLVVKSTQSLAGHVAQTAASDALAKSAPSAAASVRGASERKLETAALGMASRQGVSGIEDLRQTNVTGLLGGTAVYANVTTTGKLTGRCPEPELAEPGEKPLVIIKWPDNRDPHLGDIVTFFIQYKNQGQRPITGIVVNDSLTARLEYVAGSARSDRDALFTVTPNEAGSTVVRWEITAPLPPGQSGTVTFQARVR
jgi:uncharacterized repeat protein (TIGR01451 family)